MLIIFLASGLVSKQTSKVEETTKKQLSPSLSLSPPSLSLPPTPGWDNLLLTLLGP